MNVGNYREVEKTSKGLLAFQYTADSQALPDILKRLLVYIICITTYLLMYLVPTNNYQSG